MLADFESDKVKFLRLYRTYSENLEKFTDDEVRELHDVFEMGRELYELPRLLVSADEYIQARAERDDPRPGKEFQNDVRAKIESFIYPTMPVNAWGNTMDFDGYYTTQNDPNGSKFFIKVPKEKPYTIVKKGKYTFLVEKAGKSPTYYKATEATSGTLVLTGKENMQELSNELDEFINGTHRYLVKNNETFDQAINREITRVTQHNRDTAKSNPFTFKEQIEYYTLKAMAEKDIAGKARKNIESNEKRRSDADVIKRTASRLEKQIRNYYKDQYMASESQQEAMPEGAWGRNTHFDGFFTTRTIDGFNVRIPLDLKIKAFFQADNHDFFLTKSKTGTFDAFEVFSGISLGKDDLSNTIEEAIEHYISKINSIKTRSNGQTSLNQMIDDFLVKAKQKNIRIATPKHIVKNPAEEKAIRKSIDEDKRKYCAHFQHGSGIALSEREREDLDANIQWNRARLGLLPYKISCKEDDIPKTVKSLLNDQQITLSGYDDDKTRFESILDLYISNANKFTASEINELNEVFELGKELFGSERVLPKSTNSSNAMTLKEFYVYLNDYCKNTSFKSNKTCISVDYNDDSYGIPYEFQINNIDCKFRISSDNPSRRQSKSYSTVHIDLPKELRQEITQGYSEVEKGMRKAVKTFWEFFKNTGAKGIQVEPKGKNPTYTNHYAFHKAITEKKTLLPIDHFLFYKSAAKEQKTGENADYDHIDYPEVFSLEWIKKVNKSLINNKLSINDFKKAFAYVQRKKPQIQVLLSSYSKDALLSLLGSTSAYRYKSEKKDRVIDAVYNSIEKTFQLGTITFTLGENIHDAIAKKVEKTTQSDLTKYAEDVQKDIAEYKQYIEKSKKSLSNPETIEEFEYFLSKKPKSELTAEQLRRYDELLSSKILERREIEFTKKAEIKKVENVSEMTLTETTHTKYNYPLYVVQLQGRVEKDTYNELNSSAKKLGGWYSSFRGSGAVPGFQFKDKAQAEKFMALREGDITNIERKEEIKTEKTEARADKLRATAESMIAKADQELGKERMTNTYRRANMANNADSKALNQKRLAQTMLNIADVIDSGKAKYLNYISTTTQIELLESIVRDATRREHSEKYKDAYERRKHENDTATIETVDYIGIGYYPSIYVETIRELIKTIGNKSGGKLLAQRWTRKLQDYSREQRYQVKSDEEMSELKRMVELLSPSELKYSRIHEIILQFARLKAMKIDNDSMLREVVREFIMYRAGKSEQSKVTMLERSLAGKSNVGIDYFPTPKELAERMVEMADIEPGMSVLEPSAGNGNIADAIKKAGVNPDVIELSSTLREILEAKGYPLVGSDFIEFDSKKYDRIIMNPPFSDSQDAQHIKHAYSLLKPGGRIVSIAGEGIFFRKDKKSVDFQEFLDEKNAVVEKLPEKTFTDKKLYSTTGANARLVVIDKSKERKNNSLSDNMKKQESTPTYPTIPQSVADEIGQAFIRAGQMDFVRLMKNPAVANTAIQALKKHGIINAGNQTAWISDSTTLTDNGITILRESLWKTIFPNLGTSDFPVQVSDKVLKNLSSFLKIRQNPRIFGQFEIAVQIGNEFAGSDDTVMFDDPLDAQEFAFLCPFLYDTKNDKFEWVMKKYIDWNGKTDRKEFLESLSGEIGQKKQRQSTFGLSDQYVWR